MNKRLAKRHKRHVARKREHTKISEPDLRTPEQIKAAREAGRTNVGRGNDTSLRQSTTSTGNRPAPGTGSSAKTDA
jgi:hypothetical protein